MNKSNCTAVKSSTGLGKSTMMRKHAVNFIKSLRQKNDQRSVVVFVPTIKLAKEQMDLFNKDNPSLQAECFIGSQNDNPNKHNIKMCERSEAVSLIHKGIALSALCGNQRNGWCKYHIKSKCNDPCGYSTQKDIRSDIWFMAHQMLFLKKPSNIDPATVVIDESFNSASISNKLKISYSGLTQYKISDDYAKACKLLMPILLESPSGYLDVNDINEKSAYKALDLCFKALADIDNYYKNKPIKPAMSFTEINKVMDSLPNVSFRQFWRVLATAFNNGAIKTPYLKKITKNTSDEFFIEIIEKRNIHKDWHVNTLILDATLSEPITNLYFSKVNTEIIECPMSNTTVTQISDRPLSKMMMLPNTNRSNRKNAELTKNLNKLIFILIVRLANIFKAVHIDGFTDPIKILLVTNKAIEEKLLEFENFPKGVATMHYGATSGIDGYKNVPSIVLAGRLMLPADQAEIQGSLLTGSIIQSEHNNEPSYSKHNQIIKTKYHKATINSDYHSHAIVEEVRYSKTEGELIQAIGRARGLRRNKNNPLDVLILTNVPIPIPVDLLATWEAVVPSKLEALLANNKIAPLSYNELVRIHPNSFKTIKVARTAVDSFYKRYPTIKNIVKSNLSAFLPIYNISREKGTQFQHYKELQLVRFTRNVKGAKPCFAVVSNIKADIEEALALVVGELKSYRSICTFSAESNALPDF